MQNMKLNCCQIIYDNFRAEINQIYSVIHFSLIKICPKWRNMSTSREWEKKKNEIANEQLRQFWIVRHLLKAILFNLSNKNRPKLQSVCITTHCIVWLCAMCPCCAWPCPKEDLKSHSQKLLKHFNEIHLSGAHRLIDFNNKFLFCAISSFSSNKRNISAYKIIMHRQQQWFDC